MADFHDQKISYLTFYPKFPKPVKAVIPDIAHGTPAEDGRALVSALLVSNRWQPTVDHRKKEQSLLPFLFSSWNYLGRQNHKTFLL
jgi:hypothetical protein